MNYMYLIFISDQFLILEVLKQPLFDDSMVDSECPTLCDTYIFFVSMQAWIREEGINFCLWKPLDEFFLVIKVIHLVGISNLKEKKFKFVKRSLKRIVKLCTYYLLPVWTIHPLIDFCTVHFAFFLSSN